MIINYENNKIAMDNYIEKCKNKIRETFFYDEELQEGEVLKKELLKCGLINENDTLVETLIAHRNRLIQQKIDHTTRIVERVKAMSDKMNIPCDFSKVLKVAALLHDIGRFDQATWSNTYSDRDSFKWHKNEEKNKKIWGNRTKEEISKITNHAEWGYIILNEKNEINNFDIPKELINLIEQSVLHHGDSTLPDNYNKKIDSVNQLNLSQSEELLISTLVQMVRDADKIDIFYQHISGEYPAIQPHLKFYVMGMTVEEISNKFEISVEEIVTYNELKSRDLSSYEYIYIPLDNVDTDKLVVPQDIQEKFFNNEKIDLKKINIRQDYSFIVMMWWRLSTFLLDINFLSVLEVIEDEQMLIKLFDLYPLKYRYLVEPAFKYAQEYLIDFPLNEGKVKKKLYK